MSFSRLLSLCAALAALAVGAGEALSSAPNGSRHRVLYLDIQDLQAPPADPAEAALTPVQRKIDTMLRETAKSIAARGATRAEVLISRPAQVSDRYRRVDNDGMIQCYVEFGLSFSSAAAAVTAAGGKVELTSREMHVIQCQIPYDALERVAADSGVGRIRLPSYAVSRSGSVNSEGDTIHRANVVRTTNNVVGTGIKVGVIGDGIAGIAASQASGDIPATYEAQSARADGSISAGSEGLAMMELVYDLAPGAALAFSSANTSAEFVNAINILEGTFHCNIICDDLFFYDEPYFEDGAIGTRINQFVNAGGLFVASAGNGNDQNYYESDFVPITTTVGGTSMTVHNFGSPAPQTSHILRVLVPGGSTLPVALQWNEPFGSSTSDYSLIFTVSSTGATINFTSDSNTTNPYEFLAITNTGTGAGYGYFLVRKKTGTDRRIKLMSDFVPGYFTDKFSTTGSVLGHSAVANVIACGALDKTTGNLEAFSAQGPAFLSSGLRNKPDLCGVDNVTVTGNGGFGTTFGGTSAAAAHTAAVAALIWSANKNQTNAVVRNILQSTAVDVGAAGYDTATGFGRVDAVNALAMVSNTSMTTLMTTPNPSNFLQSVTMTATIAGATSGTVTFFDGTKSLGSAPVASGQAVFNTSALSLGTHSITAVFSGTGTLGGSTSPAVTQTVNQSTRVWTGGSATTNNWSADANWDTGHPVTGDIIIFNGTVRPNPINDLAADTAFASILFTSGGFTVTGNAVTLASGNAVNNTAGTNALNLNLTLTGDTTVSVGAGALSLGGTIQNAGFQLSLSGAGDVNLGGVVSGAGALTKATGAGVVTLSGANTYSGATNIMAGTLRLGASNVIPDTSPVVLGNNAVFDLNGFSETVRSLNDFLQTGPVTFDATAAITITDNAQASPYPAPLTVAGVTGTVTKVTATLHQLSHTYPGDIDMLLSGPGGQTLILMSDCSSGFSYAGIELTFDDSGPAMTSARVSQGAWKPSNFSDNDGDDIFPAGAPAATGTTMSIFNGVGPNGTWNLFVRDDVAGDLGSIAGGWSLTLTVMNSSTGSVNLGSGGGVLTIGAAGFDSSFSGVITGTGTLAKTSSSILTLSGANTYNGETQVQGGTLKVGAAGTIPDTSLVTVTGGATFDLNGISETVGSIAGGGAVMLGSGTLTVAADTITSSFGGAIGGIGGLTKAGTGTLVLANTQSYSGATAVNAGTLTINGILQTGGGPVNVSAGGTLRGTGTINRAVATVGSGVIWPGIASVASGLTPGETLTMTSVDLSSGGKLKICANQTDFQKLVVNGGTLCNFSGATLSLGLPAQLFTNKQYMIVDATNAATNTIVAPFPFVNTNGSAQAAVTVQYLNDTGATAVPANRVQITANGSVTPVRIAAFTARAEGAGAVLGWDAEAEFQNAGFDVYRRTSGEEEWTRVNPALIAGRITQPDLKRYQFCDWAPPGSYEYKLEALATDGTREAFGEFAGPVTLDSEEPALVSESGIAAVAETVSAEVGSIRAREVAVTMTLRADGVAPALASVREHIRRQDAGAPSDAGARRAIMVRGFSSTRPASFSADKVVYDKAGVLLIPQAMLTDGFDVRHVAVQREGRQISVLAVTPEGLLVYAPGYEDEYTNKDALFLRRIAGATAAGEYTQAHGLFESNLPVSSESPARASVDFHDVYYDFEYRPFDFAPWFSKKYLSSGTVQDFTLDAPGAKGMTATLTLNVWSLTPGEHALQALINGSPAGRAEWSGGGRMLELKIDVAEGMLKPGANVIELVTPAGDPENAATDSQVAFLHSMALDYTRTLDGSAPLEIVNTSAEAKLFDVTGLQTDKVWVVDARFTDRAVLVPVDVRDSAGGYRMRFVANPGGSGRYFVVPAGQENRPLSVSARQVKPLAARGMYLATGPSQFAAGVQPLLLARGKEGIRGQFVDQEQLFDFYNFGRYGPAGIRSAVRATQPQYLLLIGRTTYDYHNNSGNNVDPLCPAFLVATTFWAQTTSDALFGDLGRGYPEVAVGRFPINNSSELNVAVSRTLAYKGLSSAIRAHAVADRTDPTAGNFGAQLAAVAAQNPEFAWQANTLGVTHATPGEVTTALTTAANGGADLLIYAGHGNSIHFGNETPNILDTQSIQSWHGNAILIQATCAGNWMAKDESGFKSLAMQALTQPQGGIAASIGTSTFMNSSAAAEFLGQLVRTASRERMRWGQALMLSQRWALSRERDGFYADLGRTEQIFGDPALPVSFPESKKNSTGNSQTEPGTF